MSYMVHFHCTLRQSVYLILIYSSLWLPIVKADKYEIKFHEYVWLSMFCFSQAGPQTQPVLTWADTLGWYNQVIGFYLIIKNDYFHNENQDELIL